MDAGIIAGMFVISSNEVVFITVSLVYFAIHGRSGLVLEIFVQFVFEVFFAAICLVPYAL